MTEREKIIEAINSVQAYGIMSNASGGDLPVANEMLADKLIEAGFRNVADWKHRAEVAERALLFLCDNTMSDGSIMIFPSTKTQVRNNQELYDYCIKQAERELAEEKKQ